MRHHFMWLFANGANHRLVMELLRYYGIPPPNVTESLHLGRALTAAVDALRSRNGPCRNRNPNCRLKDFDEGDGKGTS